MANDDLFISSHLVIFAVLVAAGLLWFILKKLLRPAQTQSSPAPPPLPGSVTKPITPAPATTIPAPTIQYQEKGRSAGRIFTLFDDKMTVRNKAGRGKSMEIVFRLAELSPQVSTVQVKDQDYPPLFVAAFILTMAAVIFLFAKILPVGERSLPMLFGLGAVGVLYIGIWHVKAKQIEHTVFMKESGEAAFDVACKTDDEGKYRRFIAEIVRRITSAHGG